MKSTLLPLIFVFTHIFNHTAALQASNFNVTPEVAAEYTCTEVCYQGLQDGNTGDLQRFGTSFDFEFYNTASNFSNSNPGDILKLQKIDPTKLDHSPASGVPPGVQFYRFQYTSVDFKGAKIPSTGFVAIPNKKRPRKSRLRTVAFAHGTTGLWRGCAPSTSPNLFDYHTWTALVSHGYAVIATDYSGIGNNFSDFKYLMFPEHANDIFYSVVAARNAFGNVLSKEWMSIGHSEGGGSVWSLSESDLLRSQPSKAGKYLGTVAIAPATRLFDMAVDAAKVFATNKDFHGLSVASGSVRVGSAIKSIFPAYNMSIYAEKLRKRVELAGIAQLCFDANAALVNDLAGNEMLSGTDLSQETELQQFQNMTSPGLGKRSSHSILVLQGLKDTAVAPDITIATYKDSCRYGNELHLKLYPAEDHVTIVTKAAPMFLRFMDSKFRHSTKALGRCTTETIRSKQVG